MITTNAHRSIVTASGAEEYTNEGRSIWVGSTTPNAAGIFLEVWGPGRQLAFVYLTEDEADELIGALRKWKVATA